MDRKEENPEPVEQAAAPGRLARIGAWFDLRLRISDQIWPELAHHVPRSSASFWYVFGSATLLCFMVQLVTGMCLGLVYSPSAAESWASLEYLNYQQPLGWFMRSLHYWGSNFMVALMTIHVVQVFLFGAYKYPRELTWVVGCFLFLLTLAMAFTGQVMRFDQDAYWGLGIGASIAGRFPFVGGIVVDLMLGGPIIGAPTLSRFFTLHVFLVPALLLLLIAVHLWLVLKVGINEWPMPGRLVTRERYLEEYHQLVAEDGEPFVPNGVQKDLVFSGLVMVALVSCAAVLGPAGPNGPPDPTLIDTVPRPDFWFLSLFAVFALLPAYLETPLILIAPPILFLLAALLPFYSGTGEKSWKVRPGAWILVVTVFVCLGTLTWLGIRSPWSPDMAAWSGTPTPVAMVRGRTPLELQGALIVQSKQCRTCHSLGGEGGERGPALDDVATRLTQDQLIHQVLQGGGNMPAYGKNLSPAQVKALVAFLGTMHPPGQLPARDASRVASSAAPVAGVSGGR